jgi:hypothetical protein
MRNRIIEEATYLLIADTAGTRHADNATKFVAKLLSDRNLTTYQTVNLLFVAISCFLGSSHNEILNDLLDLSEALEREAICRS